MSQLPDRRTDGMALADSEEWEAPRPPVRRPAPSARPQPIPAAREAESNPALLASVFLAAASLLLGWTTPLQIQYEPQRAVTMILMAPAAALLGWGTFRRQPLVMAGGVVALLVLDIACLTTQPIQFGTSLAAAWAVRVALVSLIVIAWALLMDPADWLRRGLVAMAIPTATILIAVGGPPVFAQVTGRPAPPDGGFPPFWLAVDSHGKVYAAHAAGNEILVYGGLGYPAGTIWPGRAPAPGTPGPGIIPAGYEAEIGISNTNTLSTTSNIPVDPDLLAGGFHICGLAVDPRDNLYVVETPKTGGVNLLRFDTDGNITARWPLPPEYRPATGCLAADAEHIYLSSSFGQVYVLDLAGQVQRQIPLDYQPFGIAARGPGQVVLMGHNFLHFLDITSGTGITTTLPPPTTMLETPYQTVGATADGRALVTDVARNQVLMIDPQGQVLDALGTPGTWPGQFRSPAGLARGPDGQIYIADWQNRVIQRFDPSGKVNAVWWALELGEERRR